MHRGPNQPPQAQSYRPYLEKGEELQGLQDGRYVQGTLAVFGPSIAFVRIPNEANSDVMISGNVHRNRALHGDVVIAKVLDKQEWTLKLELHWDKIARLLRIQNLDTAYTKEEIVTLLNNTQNRQLPKPQFVLNQTIQQKWMEILLKCDIPVDQIVPYCAKSGEVVKIVTRGGVTKTIGQLKHVIDKTGQRIGWLDVQPVYNWMPLVRISQQQCPPDVLDQIGDCLTIMDDIKFPSDASKQPTGTVRAKLDDPTNLATWTTAILIANSIRNDTLPPADLPRSLFTDNAGDRRNLTDLMVFTIDPPTAQDLDDAVSCQRLSNGNFEVYVHIADVGHFIQEGTAVDKEAQARGTSVYLQDNDVVPMLPANVIQCCSLNPGESRLAVSIRYEITANGEVTNVSKFIKTIVKSRVKLSYAQAQAIVDGQEWNEAANNRMHPDEKIAIESGIRDLHRITQALRESRMRNCQVIKIDGGKSLQLCSFTTNDKGAVTMTNKEHYRTEELIEELAILTNEEAAKAIRDKFPETALFRRHAEPLSDSMQLFRKNLNLIALDVDPDSRTSLRDLFSRKCTSSQAAAIKSMAIKPMQTAKYVRSGINDTFHYALGTDLYTHMTSPIRRYADIVVHRMLFNKFAPANLDQIIDSCNGRKAAASVCQDDSWKIHMGYYLKQRALVEPAVVVGILPAEFAVEILVIRFMVREKIHVGHKSANRDPSITSCRHRSDVATGKQMFDIQWGARKMTVAVWDEVRVKLEATEADPRNFKVSLMAD